jgi:hypothetical protein
MAKLLLMETTLDLHLQQKRLAAVAVRVTELVELTADAEAVLVGVLDLLIVVELVRKAVMAQAVMEVVLQVVEVEQAATLLQEVVA